MTKVFTIDADKERAMPKHLLEAYNIFETSRIVTPTLFIKALMSPKEPWARAVIREKDALQNVALEFSNNFVPDETKDNLGFDPAVKAVLLVTGSDEVIKFKQGELHFSLSWCEVMSCWNFLETNTTLHNVYNIYSQIAQ